MRIPPSLIGFAMRCYRKSPLWPHAGPFLARCLHRVSPPSGPVQKTIDGLTYELDLREVIDASIYYSGAFEKDIESLMDALVTPGTAVIDIGANVGYHTVRLARNVGAEGRVLAIEPTSSACRRLRRNLELNPGGNVTVCHVGLSDRDEGLRRVAFQSSYPLDGRPHNQEEEVRLVHLDGLLAEIGVTGVGFVKMDVDGFEEKVIAGGMEMLRRDRPVLLLEVTPPVGGGTCPVLATLEGLGYEIYDERRRPVPQASTSQAWRKGDSAINVVALPAGQKL